MEGRPPGAESKADKRSRTEIEQRRRCAVGSRPRGARAAGAHAPAWARREQRRCQNVVRGGRRAGAVALPPVR